MKSTQEIPGQCGIEQCVFWLGLAVPYLRESENLFMGYIKSDDFWHYKSFAYAAFDNLQILAGHSGKLMLPMEWVTKSEVVRRLRELKLRTWSCECPKGKKPCGKCTPCKRLRLVDLELRDSK